MKSKVWSLVRRGSIFGFVFSLVSVDAQAQSCEFVPDAATGLPANYGSNYVWKFAYVEPDINSSILPGIYAGGDIRTGSPLTAHVLRWNGHLWESAIQISSGTQVSALLVHDEDGIGPQPPSLFIGGTGAFSSIKRWDGLQLSSVGTSLTSGLVSALYSWDEDGSGPAPKSLYLHAVSLTRNGTTFRGVAKWDGQDWTAMPFPANWIVPDIYGGAFGSFDEDGDGPQPERLFVGSTFCVPGTNPPPGGIARWNGANWELPGGGLTRNSSWPEFACVSALTTFDVDGEGPGRPLLFVGGYFYVESPFASGIVSWDGQSFTRYPEYRQYVNDLVPFDIDGGGPEREKLYIVQATFGFADFDGSNFVQYGNVLGQGGYGFGGLALNAPVPTLWVGGRFSVAFGVTVKNMVALGGCLPPCPADLDESGYVDLQDLATLLANFAIEDANPEIGDLDDDNDIDLQDLATLLAHFGNPCG